MAVRSKIWTIKEVEELKRDYPQMNWGVMMQKYGRTRNAIEKRAFSMGLKRNVEQSFIIKIYDTSNELIYEHTIKRDTTAVATKKCLINKLRKQNNRAIDKGEWILSITHNLECFEP